MNKILNVLTEAIKLQFRRFCDLYSSPEQVNDLGDCYRVKRWMKKVKRLYGFFTVLAVLMFIIGLPLISWFRNLFDVSIPIEIFIPLAIPLSFLTAWGYASLILHFKAVVKSVFKSASAAYQMGEKFETTHYQVRHEYGNTYSVSSYTENKGCAFAVFAIAGRFFLWAFFCVYIAPFLTYKKYQKSKAEIKKYQKK